MKKINIILFVFLCMLFVSCEITQEIDYKSYYKGDKLIVQGFISVEEGLELTIRKTVEPNRIDNSDVVEDVVAELYENGIKIDELIRIDDYHFSTSNNIKFDMNNVYHITAISPQMPKVVSSSIKLLDQFEIKSSKFVENENYTNIVITLQNISSESSFIVKMCRYKNGVPENNYETILFNPLHLIYDLPEGEASVDFPVGYSSDFDSLKIDIYSFSADYTKFGKSYDAYDRTRGDMFYEQPYPVYSSIEGGYGFFASYNKISFIKIPHPSPPVGAELYSVHYSSE